MKLFRRQEPVELQGTDHQMGLEEVQLCHVGGLIEQLFEISEPPYAMLGGDPGRLLQRRRRVLLEHLQKSSMTRRPWGPLA